MRNKKIFLLALSMSILFSACGRIDSNNTNSTSSGTNSAISTSESSSEANSDMEQEPTEDNSKITEATVSVNSGYGDDKHEVTVLGLKSYKKLDDGTYKDKAGKNKKYLVLFLEISNKMIDEDYINVNYLSAKVDGEEITNTVLFNEPEGFQTIFQNIGSESSLRGFVVWEVPKDWKKIEIKYSGWEDSDHLNINCTFTPDDYFDPPQY